MVVDGAVAPRYHSSTPSFCCQLRSGTVGIPEVSCGSVDPCDLLHQTSQTRQDANVERVKMPQMTTTDCRFRSRGEERVEGLKSERKEEKTKGGKREKGEREKGMYSRRWGPA